ncbi:bifunctional folylpolyglutamate synthase/dihydrofolate synthase [Chlorobium phaeobacteroides]|uniref:Dihydrofolate synthase/folylpolyglutamate synthase n=1 Tax=Chlorobium phaeobacteroides (strain DSM 266 / SMG 266 / 2430) TaxID=290317 RepID=A1BDH3_CHLPD|nr:Mur ligase family protein [Chlorobium phaeobacteroides]ABL64450.1 FolC bifunctional protein [Chlorobium phaeobacteroides DSM 266]
MNYQEALDFLYPLHRFGIKPGLERVFGLLAVLGSPHRRLGTIVHVSGTNGKGTTAAAIAAIFQAAGKKTALYTSPHLVDFTERMRINGGCIPHELVATYCSLIKSRVEESHTTFFEATTAIAFAWFASEHVEVTIVETGMGGRLDATNVVHADYVAITSIGQDHTAWLGSTPALIAAEKAAIIKKGSQVFSAVTDSEAAMPVRTAAECCEAPLSVLGIDAHCHVDSEEIGRLELSVRTAKHQYERLTVPLTGAFHASNISLAVMVAETAGIDESSIRNGLANLLQTGYRARLEKIAANPDVLLDVSHNANGIEETVNTLARFRNRYRNLFVLIGLASDKNATAIVKHLKRLSCRLVAVSIPSERSIPALELGGIGEAEDIPTMVFSSPLDGLGYLSGIAEAEDLVLVTGSFYLAGEVLSNGGWNKEMS